jgi:Protein of unknown function (DUF2442)
MIKITSIEPRGSYRLLLRFSDGSEGERDFSRMVAETGSLVKPLRDPAYFARAFTEDGTGLAWPNGLDLDAEALHEAMRSAGELRAPAA